MAVLQAIVVVVGVSACSTRQSTGASMSCELTAADSVFLVSGPVFLPCQVDRPARLDVASRQLDFRPPGGPPEMRTRCYTADVQLVVGRDGGVEVETARVLRSNNPGFADAVVASLPGWRFRAAMKDGQPVRQIARERAQLAVAVARVPAGQLARPPAPPRC